MNKVENRGLDEALFDFLCTGMVEAPSAQSFGLSLIYLGQGKAGMKITARREYTTVLGRLHGGMIAALADTAMGCAVGTLGNVNLNTVTVDMNLNYFSPVFEDTELIAEGHVIHSGKSTAVAEAELFNNHGKLVAKSRGTFFITKNTDLIGAY